MVFNNEVIGAYIEITYECNNNCYYCYNEKKHGTMDFETLKNIVDQIPDASDITISGGEPFLHPDIDLILSYIKQKKHKITIITNGTVITKEIVQLLTQWAIAIQLTFDGYNSQTHDPIRGEGSFNKMLAFLSNLRECGWNGDLIIRTNVDILNVDNDKLNEIYKLANKVGANLFSVGVITPRIIKKSSINMSDVIFNNLKQINLDKTLSLPYTIDRCNNASCPFSSDAKAVDTYPRIDVDGNVFPCQGFYTNVFCIGNVHTETLSSILSGSVAEKFRSMLMDRKHNLDSCNSCSISAFCQKGCPAKAYSFNGDIMTRFIPCDVQRNKIFNRMKGDISVDYKSSND